MISTGQSACVYECGWIHLDVKPTIRPLKESAFERTIGTGSVAGVRQCSDYFLPVRQSGDVHNVSDL
jgi:hypothetical protein